MSAAQVARGPRIKGLSDPYHYQSKATQRSKAPVVAATKTAKRTYTCCEKPEIDTSDNEVLCYNCGAVHGENNIVSEVTFGETSGGAAIVEGGFIHANQRHANSMGGTMRGLEGMGSRDQAAMNGKNSIVALGASLNQREAVVEQAYSWYKLAMNHRFIQGRRMRTVAAVAIYMAARRQPENTLMLIDLAEKIQTNVWQLGDTYKQFLEMLKEDDPAQLVGTKAVQEIEPLMLKYCRKLEFGEDSHRVADDACRVLKRMNRDWMVQGRQPAGLCGACIIIAARMNNFRRTIREVVYVVKVADSTITSRLYEYKRTQSAALTVNQFREFGPRLKVKAQPPAIWRRAEKEERREKRRQRAIEGGDPDTTENQSGDSEAEGGSDTAPKRTSKRRKSNDGSSQPVATQTEASGTQNSDPSSELAALDGNTEAVLESVVSAVEEVEAGETIDPDFVMPKKRGRPPKKPRVPVVIAEEDLEIEHELEDEVTNTIKDWEGIFKEIANSEDHELLRRSGWTAAEMARVAADTRDAVPVNTDPEIGEDEFNDDPDVATCILNPEEVRRKEAIWITENEQWLRDQQTKMLQAELEAAEDKPKKPKQKRKHHQMGDGNVLEGQPAASAADAAHKMLKKRAKAFSNHINYDRLKELFPGGHPSASPSASGQGASSASTPQAVVQQPVDVDAEGEEEEEEEEEMEEVEEEEEDLEHNYLEDDDEGFANESYDY